MALLYPSNYQKPGTYNKLTVNESLKEKARMLPLAIGKGSHFIKKSEAIVRGFVYQEKVNVSNLYPNTFTTKYPFVMDNKKVFVYMESSMLPADSWEFVDSNTIKLLDYNPDSTYYVDYQSTSYEVPDRFNLDVNNIESVGHSETSEDYFENKDYHLSYFLDKVSLDGVLNKDAVDFKSAYYSTSNFSRIDNYDGTSYIDIKLEDDFKDEVSVTGVVSRIEYKDTRLDYIWIDLDCGLKKTTLTVFNDKQYYSWNGISFKILEDSFSSNMVTNNNKFVRDDGTSSYFSFTILPSRTLVDGPSRKVTIDIINKGEVIYENHIYNVVSNIPEYTIEDIPTNWYEDTSFILSISGMILKEDAYYLVFELKNSYSTIYKIAPVTFDNGFVGLLEDVIIEGNGVRITLPKNSDRVKLFITDDGFYIVDDRDVAFTDGETNIPLNYAFAGYLIKFDCRYDNVSIPTEVLVTTDRSTKTEKIFIYDESFISIDGIISKLNMYILEKGSRVQFNIERDCYIDWNLIYNKEEHFNEFKVDYSGFINGKFATKYVTLKNIPVGDITVTSKEDFDYEVITIDGISYVVFTNKGIPYEPSEVDISYSCTSNKPSNGSTYYVTATCNREDSMYNKLIEVHSLEEGRQLLGPYEPGNYLYLANEIAWRELSKDNYFAYMQIKDSDNDNVLSREDVEKTISYLPNFKSATDIVLLGNFDCMDLMIDFNVSQNSAFQSNEHKIWIGFPKHYTDKDIINFSNKYSYRKAGDFRILVANNEATLSIDSIPLTTSVDGSLVAWALACLRRSEDTPYADSLIRKEVTAFDNIRVYDDKINLSLGSSNVMYIGKETTNFLIEEDVTNSGNLEQISDQHIYVCRYIRESMNELIGNNFDSKTSSLLAIQSKLMLTLKQMISNGSISKYLNEDGTARDIDANKDIAVESVEGDSTKYLFGYGFYTKKAIKYLLGSYVLDDSWNAQ